MSPSAMCGMSPMFQSLLSWISLLGWEGCHGQSRECPVSILVVLDQSARLPPLTPPRPTTPGVSILVVLDQSARRANCSVWSPYWRCFNPCCLGSVCSATGQDDRGICRHGFQSLLSWISLLGQANRFGPRLYPGVSILVVLDQSARPPACRKHWETRDLRANLGWLRGGLPRACEPGEWGCRTGSRKIGTP